MQQCLKCLSMMAEKRNDDIGLVEAKLAEGSALSEALKDQIRRFGIFSVGNR